MFSISLELPEFQVVKQETLETHYLLDVKKHTEEERCPYCGFMTSSIHDFRARNVRDLMVLNKPVYLRVHIRRFKCHNCFEVFSESFESIQPNKHQTNRLRKHLFELCKDTTIQDVSRKQKVAYSTLERIYYHIAEVVAEQHQIYLQNHASTQEEIVIGLDEIAVKKGHNYETVLLNIIDGNIIGMNHERSYQSTVELLETQNVISPSQVQTIVLDMWEPFHKAIRSLFPNACVVVDKYHVVQKVNLALDQVRKEVQTEQPKLKRRRFVLLKGKEKLTPEQRERLENILKESQELTEAYGLKEMFRDIYATSDYDQAESLLDDWLDLAEKSSFKSFHKVAKTIRKWKAEIIQYFLSPYTNAKTEGTNHKIKNIKRRAYGYRNVERFRTRVFLECTGDIYKNAEKVTA